MRKACHLAYEGGGLVPAAERVEQREQDLGLGTAVATDAVGTTAHAAGEQGDGGCSGESTSRERGESCGEPTSGSEIRIGGASPLRRR